MWSSEPSQQLENFFVITVLSFWLTNLADMRFDFIVIVPILLSRCGFLFVFGYGVSFFGRYPPVNGHSTAYCDINALTGRDENTIFYSTMLNWKSKTLKI